MAAADLIHLTDRPSSSFSSFVLEKAKKTEDEDENGDDFQK
jgi:hypothetical protein